MPVSSSYTDVVWSGRARKKIRGSGVRIQVLYRVPTNQSAVPLFSSYFVHFQISAPSNTH